jgi:chorismate synthase
MNTFGHNFRLTTFGESHGAAIGGVIDGVPAGLHLDVEAVQRQLDRRRPGQSAITTQRQESDRVELLSGLFEGVTTGTPIGFIIHNGNQHSSDYEEMRHAFRPSHADYTYTAKYGLRDHRGGGRASARETACRVVGGAVAMQLLQLRGISVVAFTEQVGHVAMNPQAEISTAAIESNIVRCPDREAAARMVELIEQVRAEGDTIGGYLRCRITGLPAGVGEPLFGRLNSRLGEAMLTIPAVKGVEFGMGFEGCLHLGSEMIDEFQVDAEGFVSTRTNHSGGIQGGISNGMPVTLRVAFKPVATLLREVSTITDDGLPTTLHARGRHDPCVLPRAVPVVEAMAAMTVADLILAPASRV